MVVNVVGKKEDIDMSTQKKELKVESQRELLGGLSVKNEERGIEVETVENAENVRPIFHILLCC